jgi:hypothetical protein
LRTLSSSTIFRLTISRLEAFLEGLADAEMEDLKKKLMKAAALGSDVGHSR